MQNSGEKTLNERAQQLLKAVVERYIRDGQPVGSKSLAEEGGIGLSPATIRNVLADLEENGFLRSPHTSAGRIPTAWGYRVFVNSLLRIKPLDVQTIQQYKQQLSIQTDIPSLVNTASSLLSDLTKLTGLVMLPKREHFAFRHVEFLPLSENRVLVILVLNEQEVQNRIIYTDRKYNVNELRQAANYLNETFAGQDVQAIRNQLLAAMHEDKFNLSHLMQTTLEMADKALQPQVKPIDYVIAGQSHLLELADVTGMQRLQQLFEAFTQKQDILHLLDQCLNTNGVQIFIGEESGYHVLDECSLVTASYSAEDQVVGVLGVIGPTRMAYDRVIPVVDITAKLLTTILNQAL